MKVNFADLNIEPSPNPKPLSVERVLVSEKTEKGEGPVEMGIVRNARLDPQAITSPRW